MLPVILIIESWYNFQDKSNPILLTIITMIILLRDIRNNYPCGMISSKMFYSWQKPDGFSVDYCLHRSTWDSYSDISDILETFDIIRFCIEPRNAISLVSDTCDGNWNLHCSLRSFFGIAANKWNAQTICTIRIMLG